MNLSGLLSAAAWQVLQNTFWASGLMLLLALAWRRLPVWWRCGLGLLVVLRLLLPVTPEFRWSAAALLMREQPSVNAAPLLDRTSHLYELPDINSGPLKSEGITAPEPDNAGFNFAAVLPVVWLSGVLLYGGWLALHQLLFTRWLRRRRFPADPRREEEMESCRRVMGLRRTVRLWEVKELSAPLACGIFRPCILLPAGLARHLSAAEMRHILRHELAHHQAHDLAWNVLFAAARVLHWFNPLVAFGLRELAAQREILRDADAVRAAPAAESAGYAETLLKLLRPPPASRFQTPALTSGMQPALRHLRQRIAMIPDISTRPRFTARLALAGAAALLAATTFTKAQEAAPPVKAKVAELPAAKGLDAVQEIMFKAQNIKIPRILFREAPIDQVIDFLRRSSVGLDQWTKDPEKKGVDFILMLGAERNESPVISRM